MMNDIVGETLRWAFRNVIYPTVIYGTLVLIVAAVVAIIVKVRSSRVVIAAILPVVALAFIVAGEGAPSAVLAHSLGQIEEWAKIAIGAAVAVVLLEAARVLLETDAELGPSLYVLFISSAAVFIMYAIMSQVVSSVHMLLFGFVCGGGIQMMVRGIPVPRKYVRRSQE